MVPAGLMEISKRLNFTFTYKFAREEVLKGHNQTFTRVEEWRKLKNG
jgi:hypothetical protein